LDADTQPASHIPRKLDVTLSPEQLHDVRQIIGQVIPGAQVWVFGSRVTGRARPFSDLDLLFTQPPQLSWKQRAALTDAFEASRLPFCVDVVESAGLAPGVAERIQSERVALSAL
jgi:predicted nucleotidyltransferase